MAEPNHNADELLKSYAAERRKSAPKEFHPAARRILQGEVARVYGAARGELPWWKKLAAPRFAWSLALVGILALSIVSLKRPPGELPAQAKKADAEKDMSLGLEVALETGTAPAKADNGPSPSERLLADSASLGEPAASARGFGGGAGGARPAPTVPAAEAPVVLGREVRKLEAKEARSEAESLDRTVAAVAAAPAPVQLQADKEQAPQVLFFSNSAMPGQMPAAKAVAARATTAQSQVLNRFSLDQRGSELQVRDEDGSLYKGLLTTQQQAQATYAFRVTGTNNTLRQPVVFTGRVVQTQVPALAQQQQQTRARQDQYQRAAQNSFYDNNQMRVQGQATVGQSQTVMVDAQNTIAPATPAAPAQK